VVRSIFNPAPDFSFRSRKAFGAREPVDVPADQEQGAAGQIMTGEEIPEHADAE
jgi:hypothetical protein